MIQKSFQQGSVKYPITFTGTTIYPMQQHRTIYYTIRVIYGKRERKWVYLTKHVQEYNISYIPWIEFQFKSKASFNCCSLRFDDEELFTFWSTSSSDNTIKIDLYKRWKRDFPNIRETYTMNERIGTGTDLDPFQLIEREGITTFIN